MANWGQKTYPTFVGKESHEKGPSIVRYCPLLSSNICMAPSYKVAKYTMSFSLLQIVAKPVNRISHKICQSWDFWKLQG